MRADYDVRQMYQEGQQRWPGVHLQFAAFQSHCRRVLGAVFEIAPFGADLYLCCACAAGDREALRAFDREGLAVARSAVSRIKRDPEFVKETLQELWERFLVGPKAKVSEYSARGPLQAWIRVSAARMALDRCRKQKILLARQTDLTEGLIGTGLSVESSLTRERYMRAFADALRHALSSLSSQERNVLRMHVVGRCSIDQIGRAYNVHRATAARWLERARTQIYASVRDELAMQHAGLTDSEFRSLARTMGSELELSFSVHPEKSGSHPMRSATQPTS